VCHREDAFVELDPRVHTPELDVADDVVESLQADAGIWVPVLDRRAVTGQVWARVVLAVDEGMDDVSVGRDRRELNATELVLRPMRLRNAAGSALDRGPIRVIGARHLQRDVAGAVSVTEDALRQITVGTRPASTVEPVVAMPSASTR